MGPDCVSGVMRSDREEHRDGGKDCQARICYRESMDAESAVTNDTLASIMPTRRTAKTGPWTML